MKFVPLVDIAEIIMGQSPPSSSYNDKQRGLPFFQGKAEFGKLYPQVKKWCDSPARIAQKDDVLISVRAPVGPTNLCPEKACIGRGLAAIRGKQKTAFNRFLLYYLRSIENQLAAKGKGSTFTAINRDDLRRVKTPYIPYDDQVKISNVLSDAENVLEKRREAIRLLDDFLKSTYLKMFGDPALNPRKLPVYTLRELCLEDPNYGAGSSAIPYDPQKPRYVRITDIDDFGNLIEETKMSADLSVKEENAYELEEGDLLFARSGATVGKTYRYETKDGPCVYAGYLIRFKPNPKIADPNYLFYFTKTDFYKNWVQGRQKVVAQPNINAKQYAFELKVPLSPHKEQKKFIEIVKQVQGLKQKMKVSETELQNLFNALMQRYFS